MLDWLEGKPFPKSKPRQYIIQRQRHDSFAEEIMGVEIAVTKK